MMRKFFVFFLLCMLSVAFWAQSLKEILRMADNVTTLNYARELSGNFGITALSIDMSGNTTLDGTLNGTATTVVQFSKSLQLETVFSSQKVGISLKFDPFSYEDDAENIAYEEMSAGMKLRQKVINVFFDAMKVQREISQISSNATSIDTQAKVALLQSEYTYYLNLLSTLTGSKIEHLEFPKLIVPEIPNSYTPYTPQEKKEKKFDLVMGINASFSQTLKIGVSMKYSWLSNGDKTYRPNVLDVEKRHYYTDIRILASVVREYDKRIASLFNEYSNVYGEYLNGQATGGEVKSLSNEISQTGYIRDVYCIKLLREWYLYTYFGGWE